MPFKYANRVQMTITNSPGTNAALGLTLGTATSGYQTFAAAGFAVDDTTDILITQGTAWEICRNCSLLSLVNLSRDTLDSSSAGSGNRASFTAGAVVSVINPASRGNAEMLPLSGVVTLETGTYVGQINVMNQIQISTATENITFLLPTTGVQPGDRVGCILFADSPTYSLFLKGVDAATAINGNSYDLNIGWSQLFLPYEYIVFKCVEASGGFYSWLVEQDGRQFNAAIAENNGSTTQTFGAGGTEQVAAALTNSSASQGQWSTSTKRFTPKRAGFYMCGGGIAFNNLDVGALYQLFLYKNGAEERMLFSGHVYSSSQVSQASGSVLVYLNGLDDYVSLFARHTSGSSKNTLASAKRTFFDAHWVGQIG